MLKNSVEVKMIGKSFSEVGETVGSLSLVYLNDNEPAEYVFEKTHITFFFDDIHPDVNWGAETQDGAMTINSTLALKHIKATDICTGVSGKVRYFGISNTESLTEQIKNKKPVSKNESADIYCIDINGTDYSLLIYCETDSKEITLDTMIQVVTNSALLSRNNEALIIDSDNSDETPIASIASQATSTPAPTPIQTSTPTPETIMYTVRCTKSCGFALYDWGTSKTVAPGTVITVYGGCGTTAFIEKGKNDMVFVINDGRYRVSYYDYEYDPDYDAGEGWAEKGWYSYFYKFSFTVTEDITVDCIFRY